MLIIYLILTISLLVQNSVQFIVATNKYFRKCYTSDVSHDKTLDIRFGFPRRQKANCKFKLQIEYLAEQITSDDDFQGKIQNEKNLKLFSGEFSCFQMSPREPFVYKHTPGQFEYSGEYRICVQNIEDLNPQQNNTMFQLQIRQKFDPSLMIDSDYTPLVGSTQIIQLQSLIMQIKRSISWCNSHIKQAENVGSQLIKKLNQASDTNVNATYLQILFLVIYGIIWVLVIKSFNK